MGLRESIMHRPSQHRHEINIRTVSCQILNDSSHFSSRFSMKQSPIESNLVKIPVICLRGIVLVPGQSIPLRFFESSGQLDVLRAAADHDNVFGIVTKMNLPQSHTIGTLAKINIIQSSANNSGIVVTVEATGKQRFHLVSTNGSSQAGSSGHVMANVAIIEDTDIPRSPLDSICLSSQRRILPTTSQSTTSPFSCKSRPRRRSRLAAADLTHWPDWVYKQYDANYLKTSIQEDLAEASIIEGTSNDPSISECSSAMLDPDKYSFWVMANLVIDDNIKLCLLGMKSTVQRLRCELSILQNCSGIVCKSCLQYIADKKDLFSMRQDGSQGVYVNPTGYVCEMFTVRKICGVVTTGRIETQSSWFAGYAWTTIVCTNCMAHMGWRFSTLSKKQKPSQFWGIQRCSICPVLQPRDDVPDWRIVI